MFSRVYVEITNLCNKNCSFCPGTKREPKMLSIEEFQFILNQLHGITEYIYLHVMGEPLLHPHLAELIRCGTEAGFHIGITTNGTLLKKREKELLSSGVYKVNISVHSFEEGSEEAYLTYLNECFDFADHSSKAGILTILRLWNQGHDHGRNEDILARLKERFPQDWHYGKRGIRIRPKFHLEYGERFDWPDMEKEEQGEEVFCYGLKDHFSILSNGTVVPCCLDREGEIALGNIFTDSIEELLQSGRVKEIQQGFRQRKATEELCRKCGYARRF